MLAVRDHRLFAPTVPGNGVSIAWPSGQRLHPYPPMSSSVAAEGIFECGANQFVRAPESVDPAWKVRSPRRLMKWPWLLMTRQGPSEGAVGPLGLMKGPEAPSDEKNTKGSLILPKKTLNYRGPPERMARPSEHVREPL